MPTNNKSISVTYSNEKLRILMEEYITMQKKEFTFKGVCSYILYWAMEDGKVADAQGALCEGNQLAQVDCDRISGVLDKIVAQGRYLGKDSQTAIICARRDGDLSPLADFAFADAVNADLLVQSSTGIERIACDNFDMKRE